MHLRVSTKRVGNKTYRYPQLVKSYRKEDGTPTKRIVAHLGPQSPEVIAALRKALKASSCGEALFLESEVAKMLYGSTEANLRFLDLAVFLECWRDWDLSVLLDELAVESNSTMSFSNVVLPLVLQRCCNPNSKLAATHWLPETAIPELTGLNIKSFNNSRIHRAMDLLYQQTTTLQLRLCERIADKTNGSFGALFMDVTDTFFEGIGWPMAEQTKTKTQMPNKRCLGIVLLANENGYPLRWKVVGGKTKDWDSMGELVEEIGEVEWLQNTPMVFDRAMGNQKTVAALKAKSVQFLTAAHVTAIESYTEEIPYSKIADTEIEGTDESYEEDIEKAAQAAREAGLEEIHPRLFVLDLNVAVPASEQKERCKDPSEFRRRGPRSQAVRHLQLAHEFQRKLKTNPALHYRELASSLGVTRKHLENILALLNLAPVVQDYILREGERFPFGEAKLRFLYSLAHDEQMAALEKELAAFASSSKPSNEPSIGALRFVVYFNPQLFVDVRRRTEGHCEKLQHYEKEFNKELASAKRSRGYNATYRKFAYEVERLQYSDAFDVELIPHPITSKTGRVIDSFQGKITRKEEIWQRRRRYDGFILLLGHPDLPQTGKQLVNLYRVKDTVEKDFQTIKSVIKLRPIYSYTDPKVQAHITICMLALLLMRTLEHRLRNAELPLTAPACIEALASCHLNRRRADRKGQPLYDITLCNALQQQILKALCLEHLAQDEHMRSHITLRPDEVQDSARHP